MIGEADGLTQVTSPGAVLSPADQYQQTKERATTLCKPVIAGLKTPIDIEITHRTQPTLSRESLTEFMTDAAVAALFPPAETEYTPEQLQQSSTSLQKGAAVWADNDFLNGPVYSNWQGVQAYLEQKFKAAGLPPEARGAFAIGVAASRVMWINDSRLAQQERTYKLNDLLEHVRSWLKDDGKGPVTTFLNEAAREIEKSPLAKEDRGQDFIRYLKR